MRILYWSWKKLYVIINKKKVDNAWNTGEKKGEFATIKQIKSIENLVVGDITLHYYL